MAGLQSGNILCENWLRISLTAIFNQRYCVTLKFEWTRSRLQNRQQNLRRSRRFMEVQYTVKILSNFEQENSRSGSEKTNCSCTILIKIYKQRKRKRSDSVLWQKPIHQQKCQKGKVTTKTTPQKSSITQRLRTDLGRSVGVTTATQLVWLTGLRAHIPTNCNSRLIKRTHV